MDTENSQSLRKDVEGAQSFHVLSEGLCLEDLNKSYESSRR